MRTPRTPRRASERGVVLPSPVTLLSLVAVLVAGVAFFATRGEESPEREIATVSVGETPAATPTATPTAPPPAKRTPPPVVRKKVLVEVYNNSPVKGLAATVGEKASTIGWQVVGADNWYGSVPASTVYYPKKLKAAGAQLALDLGIKRTAKAVDPMRLDRLTVILTGPLR